MTKKISFSQKFINKFESLKSWQVACLILVIAFTVFFTGLNGGFQGDDTDQIIKNDAVHSLSNIGLFFKSSTFWNGETLVGDFYRPMMTTSFSLVYTFFGANPTAYHIFQLLIISTGSFILFLFLRSMFRPIVAILMSLVFLIHPINSQIAFSIPSMQEPLMFVFGISALYVLSRAITTKNIIIAALLLFLSLLSKETAVVFVAIAALYVYLYNRKSTLTYIKAISLPVILFLILRISSVGFRNITQSAPVDYLSFAERMIMVPSMIVFYITKFLFPKDLATSYYWTHKTPTVDGFFIPLLITLFCLAGFIYAGLLIYRKKNKNIFKSYIFFAVWATLGLLPYMQIIALDMTACETWFYASMVGFLGMITLIIINILPRINPKWMITAGLIILIILGVRTSIRGMDYKSQETLSLRDIRVTDKNYLAMNNLSKYYIDNGNPKKAEQYAMKSIEFFPAVSNYINLGVTRQKLHDLEGAKEAYLTALEFVPLRVTYENLAIVYLTIGNTDNNIIFLKQALAIFPNDNRLWTYMAIEQSASNNNEEAQKAILQAYRLGPVPKALYESIFNKTPLDIPMPDSDRIIKITWNES